MQNALASMCLLPLLFLQLAASSEEACDASNMAECDSTSLLQLHGRANSRKSAAFPNSLTNAIAGASGSATNTVAGGPLPAGTPIDAGTASNIAQQAVQDVIKQQIADQLKAQIQGSLMGPMNVNPVGEVPPQPVNVAGVRCGTTTASPCVVTSVTVSLVPEIYYSTTSVFFPPCETTPKNWPCNTSSTPPLPVWPCITTPFFDQNPSTTTINPCETTTQVDNITVWIDYSKPQVLGPHDPDAPKIPQVPGLPTLGAEDNLPNLTIVILPPTEPPTGPPTPPMPMAYAPPMQYYAPAPAMPYAYAPAPAMVPPGMPCAPTVPPAALAAPCATQPSAIGYVQR